MKTKFKYNVIFAESTNDTSHLEFDIYEEYFRTTLNSAVKTSEWKAIFEREHEFWTYSDYGMHKECFNN